MPATEIIDAHLQYLSPQMIRSLWCRHTITSIILHLHQVAIVENYGYVERQMVAERSPRFEADNILGRGGSMRCDSIKTIAGIRIAESIDIPPDVALLMNGSQEIVRIVNLGRTGPPVREDRIDISDWTRPRRGLTAQQARRAGFYTGPLITNTYATEMLNAAMREMDEQGVGALDIIRSVTFNRSNEQRIEVINIRNFHPDQKLAIYSADGKILRGYVEVKAAASGSRNLVAIRGDLPAGTQGGDLLVPYISLDSAVEEQLPKRRIRRKDAS